MHVMAGCSCGNLKIALQVAITVRYTLLEIIRYLIV